MADIGSLLTAIPPVTRLILVATGLITLPTLLGVLSPADVALSWWKVTKHYEIWRPFTNFFFGGAGFPLVYDVFLIYRNSSAMERDVYFSNTAEYAWMHIMLATGIMLLNVPFGFPFLFHSLLAAQTYIWCRANATLKVSIFGLITIPTSLLPFINILLDLVIGGLGKALCGLIGLLVAHAWWFLSTFLPLHAPTRLRRRNPLATPIRFQALFPRSTSTAFGSRSSGPVKAPAAGPAGTARSEAVDAVRHRWGGGNKLGGSTL
ncbi:Der1-like family-domain-containing protein [Dioszegia hungarica]|uniref:Derlin n=1 Tax=Dioszegia hungarica TaxID=4972 RepID=A0AA38H9Q1_9TREE|nr:Der1-like family-domain-containing protein [Dioszegia hungarica]KAI9636170.1 Der1-like family-domain-containing protein [Dioszegia hungarica]